MNKRDKRDTQKRTKIDAHEVIILQINDVIDTRIYYVTVWFDSHNLMCHCTHYIVYTLYVRYACMHACVRLYTYIFIQTQKNYYVDAQGRAECSLFLLSSLFFFLFCSEICSMTVENVYEEWRRQQWFARKQTFGSGRIYYV